jgi:hypothetical protein
MGGVARSSTAEEVQVGAAGLVLCVSVLLLLSLQC